MTDAAFIPLNKPHIRMQNGDSEFVFDATTAGTSLRIHVCPKPNGLYPIIILSREQVVGILAVVLSDD